MDNGFYTINHVHESFVERAHYTSAKFREGESEFEKCNLKEEYIQGFKAPFVMESHLKMGMRFLQEVPIEVNQTIMIIGQIEILILREEIMDEDGHLDLNLIHDVGISGLNSYYKIEKIAQFPYARTSELPDFDAKNNK
jgi:flavin reductase (DIM6/NTAB) family NADH-FMN oxidoreductase RutF